MDAKIVDVFQKSYETNWYFRARSEILSRFIRFHRNGGGGWMADLGAGTGGILAGVSEGGRSVAVEGSPELVRFGRGRHGLPFVRADAGSRLPFRDAALDTVSMFDVLEHLDRDGEALEEIYRILRPGGKLLLTVPAFSALWSSHDEMHHHRRRYSRSGLTRLLVGSGFSVRWMGFYNMILFPLVLAVRLFEGVLSESTRAQSEYDRSGGILSPILYRLFRLERLWITRWRFPVGVSLLAVARKPVR